MTVIYKMPIIKPNARESLLYILSTNTVDTLFEHVEEIVNPIGRQWVYMLTTIIQEGPNKNCLVEYTESLFDQPNEDQSFIAEWLHTLSLPIKKSYRGTLT